MQAVYKALITLQSPSGARDTVGERTTTWANAATAWADISPLSVRDLLAAGQTQSEVSHRIKIRHSAATALVDSSWRVLYGTRIFVISGVRNLAESSRVLELICHEGVREE